MRKMSFKLSTWVEVLVFILHWQDKQGVGESLQGMEAGCHFVCTLSWSAVLLLHMCI